MKLDTGVSKNLYLPHPEARVGNIRIMGEGSRYAHQSALIDLTGDVTIGAWTMFGKNVTICTHDHNPRAEGSERIPLLRLQEENPKTIIVWMDKTIEDDVWIHHGTIVTMKCDFIARGTIIGAGSIVTKPIREENTIWAGNPARRLSHRFKHDF